MFTPRRILRVLATVGALLIVAASLAVMATQTAWFKEWLRGLVVRHSGDYVNGQLSIGRLHGNLFSGIGLDDVQISMDGRTVVSAAAIRVDYDARTLMRGSIVIDRIAVERPVVRVEPRDGGWNVAQLVKSRTRDADESNDRTVVIRRLDLLDGTLHLDEHLVQSQAVVVPHRIASIDLSLALTSAPGELIVTLDRLSFRAEEPSLGVNALTGTIRRTSEGVTSGGLVLRTERSSLKASGTLRATADHVSHLDVGMSSDTFVLDEIAALVPPLRGYRLSPRFTAKANGPLDRLRVAVNVSEPRAGHLTGDVTVHSVDPRRRVTGTVAVERFNVASIVEGIRGEATGQGRHADAESVRSDITGNVSFDVALPEGRVPLSGTFNVRAPRVKAAGYDARAVQATGRVNGRTIRLDAKAEAYGARATASGTITTGDQLVLDLTGHASDVDLRALPASLEVPAVDSALDLEYSVHGRGAAVSGSATLASSTLAGARIHDGTTAEFSVDSGAIRYAAQGAVSELDLQRIGAGFGVAALNDDRYRSRVNAMFTASGETRKGAPITLDATATLVDTTVFQAAVPGMDVTAHVAGGDARITAVGDFSNLDPVAVTQAAARAAGKLSGSVDVETTLRKYAEGVTVDSIDLAGRVSLKDSTIQEVLIESVVVEGRYAERRGELTRLEVTGADVQLSAHGPISLADTGSTDVTFHAETSSLERVGQIAGRPLKGAGFVDGKVTGNGEELDIRATVKASDIGDGENGALSLASDVAVAIPDLTPERFAVKASSVMTFLEIRGQKVNELAAETAYSESRLEFTARAQHGMRKLEAGGTAIFQPDHQEIHLPRLTLQAEKIEWSAPGGSQAAVRYFPDRIEIEDLQLTSNDQRIRANGVLGSSSEPLRIEVDNVDVAEVDRLLLGDGRLSGRLSAEAAIAGPLKDPAVEAGFTLSQGGFRTFAYESLSGRVDYAGRGLTLDVRLQATPTEWLAAKGFAPLTLFRANPSDMEGAHQDPAPGEAIDIQVTSSEIGLGLIQAFTPSITKVTGVMQANVTVTGSGHDPHFGGSVSVRGGSFAVPALGTAYSGLDTDVVLEAEGVSIRQFKVLDDRGSPMTIGGTLAMHSRSVGAVNISLESSKFEVVDNEFAALKLNANVQVTGDLRKPRVVGSIEVENGTIHLAELIERVTSKPYAVQPSTVPGLEAAPPAKAEAPVAEASPSGPGPFDRIDLDVALAVPSNLVLRGRDVQTAGAPVSLGDINVTVGGMIQVRKPPAEPLRLVGDIRTIRGTYTFQGRRFDIERDGRIGFSGSDEIDPLLDLQAKRTISGVDAFVRVRGTMKKPELSFTSSPPLEEADILALIIFNQPLNELGEGEQVSLARRAGALAGGYLTSGLTRSIAGALDLDEFEIQAQDERGAPSIRIGEQIGRNLFFLVRQAFGTEQTTELILEYQITDFLRLQATGAQGSAATERVQFRRVERAGLDLLFSFSY